jgi:glucose/arabinose dehydrogenase
VDAKTPGAVMALRDTNGDGKFEMQERFGDQGGTGIALRPGYVYHAQETAIVRYPIKTGELKPSGPAEIVAVLPEQTGHRVRPIGSRACPGRCRVRCSNDTAGSGVSNKTGLGSRSRTEGGDTPPDCASTTRWRGTTARSTRSSTGAISSSYHDWQQGKRVQSPEYRGDGKKVGDCAKYPAPVAAFPGHWAPGALLFYTGSQFPAKYRGGAFIAFQGSWNRAPEAQGGYNVTFQAISGQTASGPHEVFADGFAGAKPLMNREEAAFRPSGLAQAVDGSIYISDLVKGRIWRVMYRGGGPTE